ncbi:hypothetical protein SDC9_141752 [bioreactor metagenome]|uniref:Uncharacterized protein n=1 Tax=bioreactor metagenome TaxID=1076179 RepID=A0A645DYK5_9ZZZZ
MPESIITGNINTMPEIKRAINWELTTEEITSPSDRLTKIYTNESNNNHIRFPATGTPSRKTDSNNMEVRFTSDSTK